MNNYVKTLIRRMAYLTDTSLTQDHFKILEYTYNYYKQNHVGPMHFNIKKKLGYNQNDIQALFPHGLKSVYTWVDIPIQSPDQSCKPFPSIQVKNFREVYLDHNATTYVRPEISNTMIKFYGDKMGFGNPSSSTEPGKESDEYIERARSQIACCLEVQPDEIIFTGCGSEANNLAIKGIAFQHLKEKGHFITSKVEHSSVLNTMHFLKTLGFTVTYLDVDKNGFVNIDQLKQSLTKDTLLVAIMAANNEIGTINPIADIAKICNQFNVPLMMDAIQAFGRIPLKPKELGISMLSLSGHKIYAPKGVGALYVSRDISLTPLIHGGSQEYGIRAGTENVGHIIAFGKAAVLINNEMETENKRLVELRYLLFDGIYNIYPEIIINGPMKNRLPQNLSVGFPGIDSGALLLSLNHIGVYTSSGSACSSGSEKSSHVLDAIGLNSKQYGTIRFSMGLRTTREDIEYILNFLPQILEHLSNS